MRDDATRIRLAVLLLSLAWVVHSVAQDEPIPDAITLMQEVWDAEERITTVRGTFSSKTTINHGGVSSSIPHASGSEFAVEFGKRFRYRVTSSEGGYTTIATRERVIRRFPQVLEEFPLTVWDFKPSRLAADILFTNWEIESVLRPLHGVKVGITDADDFHAFFKDSSLDMEGDIFLVRTHDAESQAGMTYRIDRQHVPHLVGVEFTGALAPRSYKFEGAESAQFPGIWVATRSQLTSGQSNSGFNEFQSIDVDWESLNLPLPDSLFEVDETNAVHADYRRLGPRLSFWLSDGVFDDPTYSFENFREMFPGLFAGLLAVLVIASLIVFTLLTIVARRLWRYRKGAENA